MSKSKNLRQLPETSACVNLRTVRISPQKLNLLAKMIRGKAVDKALDELAFSPKRIAKEVHKALMSAIANAENNHHLDVDRLVVTEASVGKSIVMKRMDIKGRSRMGRIIKPFSHLRLVVSEREEIA